MRKIALVLIVCFANYSLTVAQISKSELAGDKFFSQFELSRAISQYEEVDIDQLSTNGLRKFGDAYRYTHDEVKSEEVYSKLVKRSDNKAEDLFTYAELLLMNKKMKEASLWMDKFHERLSTDSRGAAFYENRDRFNDLYEDLGRFKIKNIDANTKQEDFGTAFYGSQIAFSSSRGNKSPFKRVWNWSQFPYLNIYVSDKEEDNELTDVKLIADKINKKYHEAMICYSEDMELMVYTRNNYESKSEDDRIKLKMFYREKDKSGKWGEIKGFDFNNENYSVGHPSLSQDKKTLYFSSDMPGSIGGTDLYKTVRTENGWSAPENLGDVVNTEGAEMFPFIHPNGMLFFASNGHFGVGGLDVFMSKLQSSGKFSKPTNLGYPINDSKDDFAFILDSTQTFGYFSSNRPGGKGSDDIYSFRVFKKFCKQVDGFVVDDSNKKVPGASIVLFDEFGHKVEELIADNNGRYEFCLDPGKYRLETSANEYRTSVSSFSLDDEDNSKGLDIVLASLPDFMLEGLVVDAKTSAGLKGAKITMTDLATSEKKEFLTDWDGLFLRELSKNLNDTIEYDIVLEKEGYFTKKGTISKVLSKPGVYHIADDLFRMDLQVAELSQLVDIHSINFDLNKSDIREDAAIELDKIVKVMNTYPEMIIELGSHTDCRASRLYNAKLSNRRAVASADYIKQRIENPERIYGFGYGEERLLNDCGCEPSNDSDCSEEQHAENRRTEFVIMSAAGANVVASASKANVKKAKRVAKKYEAPEETKAAVVKKASSTSSIPTANVAVKKSSNVEYSPTGGSSNNNTKATTTEKPDEELSEYVIELQRNVITLQKELLEAKEEIIKVLRSEKK